MQGRHVLYIVVLSGAILGILEPCAAQLKFNLVHTNDIHARLDEFDKSTNDNVNCSKSGCYGGMARLYHFIQDVYSTSTVPVVYLDAGDIFQGTLWFTLYGPVLMAKFMNILNPRAQTLGNHEFDRGPEGLAQYLSNVTFPVLSANINASADPYLRGLFKPYEILDVNGTEVGVIGVTTEDTVFLSATGDHTVFSNITQTMLEQVSVLTNAGVKIIIGLTHQGYPEDVQMCKNVPGLDIIVGGHSHSLLYSGPAPDMDRVSGPYPTVVERADGTLCLVVTSFFSGKYIGNLTVTFDRLGNVVLDNPYNQPVLTKETNVEQDEKVAALVDDYREPLTAFRVDVVGSTEMEMPHENIRMGETLIGNVVTDSLAWYLNERQNLRELQSFKNHFFSSLPLIFINSGAIRIGLLAGNITRGTVLSILPFNNFIAVVSLTGDLLYQALEEGCARYGHGSFPQTSGIRLNVDPDAPAFHRVSNVTVRTDYFNGTYMPLDPKATYSLVVNDYMLSGGDAYFVIRDNAEILLDTNIFADSCADIFAEYVSYHSPLTASLEGRIRVVPSHVHPGVPVLALTIIAAVATLVVIVAVVVTVVVCMLCVKREQPTHTFDSASFTAKDPHRRQPWSRSNSMHRWSTLQRNSSMYKSHSFRASGAPFLVRSSFNAGYVSSPTHATQ